MRLGLLIAAAVLAGCASATLNPKDVEFFTQTKRLYDSGKYAQVINALSGTSMQRLRGRELRLATIYLATSFERSHQFDRALSVYQLGINLFPKDVDLMTGQAELFHAARLEEQAQPLYKKILAIQPDNTRAHLGLAAIDRALGFLDRSAEHYRTALAKLKDDAEVWRDYAEVLLEKREFASAETAILRSLEISPQILDSNLDLAFILRAQGRRVEGLATLDKMLAVTGRQNDLLRTRALWLLELGRAEEALGEAQAILKDSPEDALALWIRGRARLSAGAKDAALADFRAAAAAKPESLIADTANILARQLEKGADGK